MPAIPELPSLRLHPDTGSHAAAASGKTRANTNSGVGPGLHHGIDDELGVGEVLL